jgi:hypothetical protein
VLTEAEEEAQLLQRGADPKRFLRKRSLAIKHGQPLISNCTFSVSVVIRLGLVMGVFVGNQSINADPTQGINFILCGAWRCSASAVARYLC